MRQAVTLGCFALAGCFAERCSDSGTPGATHPTAAPTATASIAPGHLPAPLRTNATHREGGALRLGVGEASLYVADEDHKAIRRIALPIDTQVPSRSFDLPGPPAQVLPLAGRILVTVRDPGLLLLLELVDGSLVEKRRVELPSDAWGIAVSKDEQFALVTSAWSSQVSAVDLASFQKLWSVSVAREPRAIVLRDNGQTAYVTHLVGAPLTKLDATGQDGLRATPRPSSLPLPPAPLRSTGGTTLHSALGYAALLSPDESRLFVARHALGALGDNSWFGASTVDVLVTATHEPLAPRRHDRLPFLRADKGAAGSELVVPGKPLSPFTQPRALAYRRKTETLLVASEGDDLIAELATNGLDPTRSVLHRYRVGGGYDPNLPVASTCGAPSGLALSEDEQTLWVWCRSTYDLATIKLIDFATDATPAIDAKSEFTTTRLAADALDADGAIGRRLFYNATDRVTSGGLACAGCHPEGRDDGHVWHEAKFNTKDGTHQNFVGESANIPVEEGVRGVPRRTPMLAGMLDAEGPYGWLAESPHLAARLKAGFGLHRWGGMPKHESSNIDARTSRLAAFVRRGLVPPPGFGRELNEEERRGRELFSSAEVGCATCHVPETGYTNRVAYALPQLPTLAAFDPEDSAIKTPSLRFVGGRAPYFHDGRASSLEWLIHNNTKDRMGRTNQLSSVDRAALIAFLRTL